jgi:nucleotide-binding universal stress UspA family protein
MSIARVVIGLDGNPPSIHALSVALTLLPPETEFLAVYAFHPSSAATNLGSPCAVAPPPPIEEWRDALSEEMEEVWCAPLSAAKRSYKARVVDGLPAATLLEAALEFKADLIIIGHHRRATLSELVLGSDCHELLRQSHYPVLLIPLSPHEA